MLVYQRVFYPSVLFDVFYPSVLFDVFYPSDLFDVFYPLDHGLKNMKANSGHFTKNKHEGFGKKHT